MPCTSFCGLASPLTDVQHDSRSVDSPSQHLVKTGTQKRAYDSTGFGAVPVTGTVAQANLKQVLPVPHVSLNAKQATPVLSSVAMLESQRRTQQLHDAALQVQQSDCSPSTASRHVLKQYSHADGTGSTYRRGTHANVFDVGQQSQHAGMHETPLACVALLTSWGHDKQSQSDLHGQLTGSSPASGKIHLYAERREASATDSMNSNR